MKKGSLILPALLINWLLLFSQAPHFNFEKFTTDNGLNDNNTGALLQDSRGFLWIGTGNGLSRYDGRLFKQYTILGRSGLTDLAINTLAEDGDGNIWIGTGSGLNKLDPYTESITHYIEGTGPGTIPYKWCNYLYVDKRKDLWLTTEKGIALYDKKSNSFHNYPVTVYGADIKINKFINRVLEDSRGRFWLATSYGVKLFDRTGKTYRSFHFDEPTGQPVKENITISLFEDDEKKIWAGTWGGGLLKYNEAKNIFEKVIIEDPPDKSLTVTDITGLTTAKGFFFLLIINGKPYSLEKNEDRYFLQLIRSASLIKESSTATDSGLTTLLVDLQKNIWAGGNNGLYKMRPSDAAFRSVAVNTGNPFIYHIITGIKDPGNDLYLTSPEGWWKYSRFNKSISAQPLPANENNLLKYINDYCADARGYWFTSVNGFGYYDVYKNEITDLSSVVRERSGQLSTGFIAKDGTGKLWITMRRSGILVYDPFTKRSDVLFADSSRPDNTFGYAITDIKYHRDGTVYFCANNKLFKVNATSHSYKIISAPPYDETIDESRIAPDKILITSGGRVFISSKLRIYELKQDHLETVFPTRGQPSFYIEKITSASAADIWVTTTKAIFKTDTAFKKWMNISSVTGKENESFLELNTSIPGEVVFNGHGRIDILEDSLLPKGIIPPMVMINRVKYGEKENYFVSLKPVNIRSSYKDAIEIELSAIDFLHDKENTILYQLDGWDKGWKELAGKAVIRYEQLPPGDYIFKTRTINTEGAESKETTMAFSVVPPFYRTGWFISLALLLVAGVLYTIYRYRMSKMLEMEKLRTRIATDLHDDIGATLSSISMYSEAVKNLLKETNPQLENILDRMGENSRDMVASMSDIVWAINPDNDDGQKLIGRMESYATDICAAKNIRLHFQADEKLANISLPLEHRKNIYLIFKEAVNNAVKYSDAGNINVSIEVQGRLLLMKIADDGRGFNETMVKKGNGLKNMYARAAEIKGTIQINAVEGAGTSVCLNCSF